jgi:hypothetical protein
MFYALMSQLPGYSIMYREPIKEGIVNDFLVKQYGENHGRQLRISTLSDAEYRELLSDLRAQVNAGKTVSTLQTEAVRKRLIHQIFTALSRIGASPVNGDYSAANRHITGLPIAKGRMVPQIPTDELPGLLGAVRAYCDVIRKRQQKEKALAAKN